MLSLQDKTLLATADSKKAFNAPSLSQTGLMLYIHTIIGGALWGLSVSLYRRYSLSKLWQNIYRTALVTGFVPAYFIGGIITVYNTYIKDLNQFQHIFLFNNVIALSVIIPWIYLIPILDVYCPLWLGGHIVGFTSFFLQMYIQDADLLKSDHNLKQIRVKRDQFIKKREQLRKNQFFQLPSK